MSDEWVGDLNLVGSPADVVRKLRALAAPGVDHGHHPARGHSEGGRPRMETVRAFTEHVVPKFQ